MTERTKRNINKSIAFNHSNIIESVINELMLASCDERLLSMLEESTYEVVEYIDLLEGSIASHTLPVIDEQNFKTSPVLNRKIFENESKGFLQTIDDLNKQITYLKAEREKNFVNHRDSVNKLLHENNNFKQILEKLRQEVAELNISCTNKEKQINILKIELNVAEDNVKSLKRDISNNKKSNNIIGKDKDNNKHLTENIGLKAGIDTLKHQLQKEKNDNKTNLHQITTQVDIMKRKWEQAEENLIQKNIEINSLSSLKDDLYHTIEKYSSDMIDRDNEYSSLQQLYQEAQIGSEKYYKLYNEMLKENQSQFDYYTNKEKLLNQSNKELRNNLNKFRANLINLQNEIIELKDSNNTTECFTELSNKRLQTQIEVLISQNETLWQSSIDQDNIINNTTKIINNLTQRINSPVKNPSPITSPLRIPIINNLNDSTLSNNIYLILKQKDDEIASLKEQYAMESKDIANHISSMEDRLSKLNDENQNLREFSNTKNSKNTEVIGTPSIPNSDNKDDKSEEIALWKSQVVSLKAQLEEILSNNNPSEMQNRINYLEIRSKVLEDQIHSMPSTLQVAQAEKKVIEMKTSKIIENMMNENAILKQQSIQQNKELHTLLSIEVAEKESLRDRVKEQALTVHQLTNSLKLLQDQLHNINDNPVRKHLNTQSLYKDFNILATPWETSNNNISTTTANMIFQSPFKSNDNKAGDILENSPIKWAKNDNIDLNKDNNITSISKTHLTDQPSLAVDNTNIKDVIVNNEAKFQDLRTFLQSLDGIYM